MLGRRAPPPPTQSANMLKEYLDIIHQKQAEKGKATMYDIYRRAMSDAQTHRVIRYMNENYFIEGNEHEGYKLTKKGEEMREILKKRDLVGILTRDLRGPRIRPW